jgi:hypothetical protein
VYFWVFCFSVAENVILAATESAMQQEARFWGSIARESAKGMMTGVVFALVVVGLPAWYWRDALAVWVQSF